MLRIILVDDSKDDLLLAQRAIRDCKILNPVLTFLGGEECISYLQSLELEENATQSDSSLILLDLIMPPTGGLEVLKAWNGSLHRKFSMVVMLSGLTDLKAVNEGYQLGAKTFLVKPMTKEDLLEVLNSSSDLISVESTSHGYMLHWRDALNPSDGQRQAIPVLSLSA